MKTKHKVGLGMVVVALLVILTGWYLHDHLIPVLQPAGPIGAKERNLIIFCAAISAVIVVPVFGLLGYFGWKYREGNHKATYTPELGGSKLAETIWWIVPSFIIVIISIVIWQSSYALDPFKPLASGKSTLHIQVVALDWKWLFIYPGSNMASVNEVAIPVGTPVDFEITSDSVMTSFWAPQLGGQMYAMPGMNTHLNLETNKVGSYHGLAANISGKGFADMTFTVKALRPKSYTSWMKTMQKQPAKLTIARYMKLSKPSVVAATEKYRYGSVQEDLYDTIVMKYMMPMANNTNTNGTAM